MKVWKQKGRKSKSKVLRTLAEDSGVPFKTLQRWWREDECLKNEVNQLNTSNNEEKIPTTHGVLNELQKRRGKGKAHGSWDTPEGSLIEDSNKRLQDVIHAIEELIQVLGSIAM